MIPVAEMIFKGHSKSSEVTTYYLWLPVSDPWQLYGPILALRSRYAETLAEIWYFWHPIWWWLQNKNDDWCI